MSPAVPAMLHLAIVVTITLAVIGRARHMDPATAPIVRVQHGLLAGAALFSLLAPPEWAAAMVGAGAAAYVLIDRRHRPAQPLGDRAP